MGKDTYCMTIRPWRHPLCITHLKTRKTDSFKEKFKSCILSQTSYRGLLSWEETKIFQKLHQILNWRGRVWISEDVHQALHSKNIHPFKICTRGSDTSVSLVYRGCIYCPLLSKPKQFLEILKNEWNKMTVCIVALALGSRWNLLTFEQQYKNNPLTESHSCLLCRYFTQKM